MEPARGNDRLAAVFRWLSEHSGWLLILDNADTPEAAAEVEKTLPTTRGRAGNHHLAHRRLEPRAACPALPHPAQSLRGPCLGAQRNADNAPACCLAQESCRARRGRAALPPGASH
jgi:hypothetical protein